MVKGADYGHILNSSIRRSLQSISHSLLQGLFVFFINVPLANLQSPGRANDRSLTAVAWVWFTRYRIPDSVMISEYRAKLRADIEETTLKSILILWLGAWYSNVTATQYVDDLEPMLAANRDAYLSGPHTVQTAASSLTVFPSKLVLVEIVFGLRQ